MSKEIGNWNYKYQISPWGIMSVEGSLEGVEVLSICNDGTGRSRNVTKGLVEQNVSALSLEGGLRGLYENKEVRECRSFLAGVLNNEASMVAIILTPEEKLYYHSFLSMVRNYSYSNSRSAVDSITRLLKNKD